VRFIILLGLLVPAVADDVDARADALRKLLRQSPKLPLASTDLNVTLPSGHHLDFVSSLAVDSGGTIYLLQRGLEVDPVLAVNRNGQVLRSWGRELYKIPHSIRIDPKGNIWTVDAASSIVYQFTPEGKQLLRIDVGGLPAKPASAFCGTTDIAFAKGRIFISDGYANNRVVEYGPTGQKVREWGSSGQKPGQFHLPHAIAVDSEGLLYVADRENGRIQRFTLEGKYLGEWTHLGKTFSLKIGKDNDMWLGTQPHNVANGVECWLLRVNRSTGKILGAIESGGHHSIELNGNAEPMTGARPNKILWFRFSGDR